MVTKSCLQTALIQLLDKKELSDISVSELARRAGVSRTAFYSNYQTVDDVLTELIDQKAYESVKKDAVEICKLLTTIIKNTRTNIENEKKNS